MTHANTPNDIKARLARLRLGHAEYARRANLPANTIWRIFSGRSEGHFPTVERMQETIREIELDDLRYLIKLYPQEAMALLCPEQRKDVA